MGLTRSTARERAARRLRGAGVPGLLDLPQGALVGEVVVEPGDEVPDDLVALGLVEDLVVQALPLPTPMILVHLTAIAGLVLLYAWIHGVDVWR